MDFTTAANVGIQRRRAAPLTPLIDVVFLLLIFLLFGDFRHEEGQVSARLSPVGGASGGGSGRVLVTARQEGGAAQVQFRIPEADRVLYAGPLGQMDAAALRGAFRTAGLQPGRRLAVITTDGPVPFRNVIFLWDRCRELGFADIGLQAAEAGS
jgi:biopolymer transport protein ExbD